MRRPLTYSARIKVCIAAAALVVVLGSVGCTKTPALVASPTIYVNAQSYPYEAVPEALRGCEVSVVFATDRQKEPDALTTTYNFKRSKTVDYGLCTVTMGSNLTWEELTVASRTRDRGRAIPLALTAIDVRGHGPPRGTMVQEGDRWVEDPAYVKAVADAAADFHTLLSERLALTPRKDVFLFIHGYNNSLASAAFKAAQIWHWVGRQGVPAIFSWPAGSGGILRGYTQDRESGEYAVSHLKAYIRAIASCPDVEKIHFIGHSRGTDVLVTALKELHIEYRGGGLDTRKKLKMGQLVLAAPDMDLDVFTEKIGAERLGMVPEQLTIYVSRNDKAIGIAEWLFRSVQRIGRLGTDDIDPAIAAAIDKHPTLSIVNVTAKTDQRGHGYFLTCPPVLSDLIWVLRDGRRPGADNGRPLIDREAGFWELRDGYPAVPVTAPTNELPK